MTEQNELRAGRRIKIDKVQQPEQLNDDSLLAGKRIVQATLVEITQVDEAESALDQTLKPKSSGVSIKRLLFIGLMILIVIESVYSIVDAIQRSWFLGGVYIVVLLLALFVVLRFTIGEYRALRLLSNRTSTQSDALRLLNSTQIGEAQQWLAPLLTLHTPDEVLDFKESIKPHHTDKEVLQLYQNTLLKSQDEQAKALINAHATTSAMLVALSPMALLDMLAVLWRGVHLVEKLSQHYGIPLGYRSRITLYRLLLKQMVFAGAAELVSDLASTSLGAELLTKLSARAAQGLSAGVFTARLGYKAMEICRPLPQLEQKPRLLKSTIETVFTTLLSKGDNKPASKE
ncbi:TIGR01620 family protein [Pseudoalteromonas sp. MMG012]|uniref:TIGR01620 family protein n=1 Tax=Pseudoalteromonas sp. MMG012 TaxID=2822686 RepID=UPI001B39E103|nr:TIGR01620 family protein [Pseudoalteromonas sp. MMG012]MBQ4848983.1 TIGR01620 family protein [Pseudoalteromonas sp. MMG012]